MPKLSKREYHALAEMGARAFLVELKTKEAAILSTFSGLRPTIEDLNQAYLTERPGRKPNGRIATKADSAEREAWARSRARITKSDVMARFGLKESNASQTLSNWRKRNVVRRIGLGVYSGLKLLKAA